MEIFVSRFIWKAFHHSGASSLLAHLKAKPGICCICHTVFFANRLICLSYNFLFLFFFFHRGINFYYKSFYHTNTPLRTVKSCSFSLFGFVVPLVERKSQNWKIVITYKHNYKENHIYVIDINLICVCCSLSLPSLHFLFFCFFFAYAVACFGVIMCTMCAWPCAKRAPKTVVLFHFIFVGTSTKCVWRRFRCTILSWRTWIMAPSISLFGSRSRWATERRITARHARPSSTTSASAGPVLSLTKSRENHRPTYASSEYTHISHLFLPLLGAHAVVVFVRAVWSFAACSINIYRRRLEW